MFPYYFLDKNNITSRKIKKLFEGSVNLEFLNKESIINYQKKNILKILRNVKNIPFYFQYLKSIPNPQKVLQKLPIIDKKTIFENFEIMKNKNSSQKFQEINTSGTSGVVGRFLRTEDCKLKWFAHTLKIWSQNNVDIEKKACIYYK